MDDNLSIDTHINTFNEAQKLFDMEWSIEHENILIDWADKAMCYRWLHSQENHHFTILTRWFTIPVIILSTLTGTANFAQERVPADYISLYVMVVGGINIITGIIGTIAQFLKINELNESHRISSIAWDKFYRNVKVELTKNPKERIPVGQMLKLSKEEFDRLMETSPVIQQKTILKFNKTFTNKTSFGNVKKPEICDELISTETFRYNIKEKKSDKELKLRMFAKKTLARKKKLTDFISKFISTQGRSPTKDEIYDSVKDSIDEFKKMSETELYKFIDTFLSTSDIIDSPSTNVIIKNGKPFDGIISTT